MASDLTPELLAAGRREAERRGLSVEWVEADVESLPFPDADFDVVVSVVGAMFAPHHQLTADEILRVCRPGGTVTMINWSRQGLIGQLFATMAPYAPPPPPGAQPPALWGEEGHVRELFGDRVRDLRFEHRGVAYPPMFRAAADLRDYYKAYYGPTIVGLSGAGRRRRPDRGAGPRLRGPLRAQRPPCPGSRHRRLDRGVPHRHRPEELAEGESP